MSAIEPKRKGRFLAPLIVFWASDDFKFCILSDAGIDDASWFQSILAKFHPQLKDQAISISPPEYSHFRKCIAAEINTEGISWRSHSDRERLLAVALDFAAGSTKPLLSRVDAALRRRE